MRQRLRSEIAILGAAGALYFLIRGKGPQAAAAALFSLGLKSIPEANPYSFRGKRVLITGGSRGLGFVLAQELLREGASVAILARDVEELIRAKTLLEKVPGARVLTIPCDITSGPEQDSALDKAAAGFGGLDVLVNNAGAITMAPFESLDEAEFEAQMRIHFYAPLQLIRKSLKYLKASDSPRIANICSIGGKMAVPHMAPYCASKFALAGLGASIGPELNKAGIPLTTVYPGFMRTGSYIQAVFKGDQEREFFWFASMGNMPGLSMPARKAAKKILAAVRRGDSETVISLPAKAGIFFQYAFPEMHSALMKIACYLLPSQQGQTRKTGAESSGKFRSSLLAWPLGKIGKNAQQEFNQRGKANADFNLGMLQAGSRQG